MCCRVNMGKSKTVVSESLYLRVASGWGGGGAFAAA